MVVAAVALMSTLLWESRAEVHKRDEHSLYGMEMALD